MPVGFNRDDGTESECRQLLALRELRGSMERVAITDAALRSARVAMMRTALIRELLDLIAALDRRVPHVERAGEMSIARDAAALKAKALARIKELEKEAAPV